MRRTPPHYISEAFVPAPVGGTCGGFLCDEVGSPCPTLPAGWVLGTSNLVGSPCPTSPCPTSWLAGYLKPATIFKSNHKYSSAGRGLEKSADKYCTCIRCFACSRHSQACVGIHSFLLLAFVVCCVPLSFFPPCNLCLQMGLGKTLESLMLILSNPPPPGWATADLG